MHKLLKDTTLGGSKTSTKRKLWLVNYNSYRRLLCLLRLLSVLQAAALWMIYTPKSRKEINHWGKLNLLECTSAEPLCSFSLQPSTCQITPTLIKAGITEKQLMDILYAYRASVV